jgi:hypothetical protein
MTTTGSETSEFPDATADGLRLLHRIGSRRSTPPRHLAAPGPSEDEIRMIVRAASRAPDHMRLVAKPYHRCHRRAPLSA